MSMGKLLVSIRSLSVQRRHVDPHQLPLPFPPLAGGGTWELSMRVDYPASADPKVVQRLHGAGRRLQRGVLAAEWKLRRLASELETIAGLFDGK